MQPTTSQIKRQIRGMNRPRPATDTATGLQHDYRKPGCLKSPRCGNTSSPHANHNDIGFLHFTSPGIWREGNDDRRAAPKASQAQNGA